MSSFIPLNALEDYSLSSAEEHTRELQIEEGLKIFQNALHAQRQGKLDDAFDLYDALFKIDVIHLDIEDNNLSPTVGRLKYLAYKNHGILLLEHLSHNLDDLTTTEIRDQLQDILVQFADALLVDESDDSFLKLFSDLARIIGLKRLSRYALECIVTSPSRVFTFSESLLNHDYLNPEEVAILQEVVVLARQLQDYVSMDSSIYELMASQVAHVAPLKKPKYISWIEPAQFKAPRLKDLKETWRGSELVVEIGVPSWRGICKGLHDSLHRLTKRKKVLNGVTIRDPYLQIGVEISSVHGKLVDEEDLENAEEDVEMVDVVDKPADETIKVKTEEDVNSTVKVEDIPAEINTEEMDKKSSAEASTKSESPEEDVKKEEATTNGNGTTDPAKEPTVKTEDQDSSAVTIATKRPNESSSSNSQPPSKRTRGRGADEPAEEEKKVDPGFFNNITSFVGGLDLKFPFVDLNQLDNEEQFYQDFKAVISNWGEQGSELFLKLSSAPESNLSVPVTQILDSAAQVDDDYGAPCAVLSISPDQFLEQMSESCSLSDFRFKIIEALLGNSSLVDEIWPSELIASIQVILNHLEPQILRDVRQMFFDGQTHSDSHIKRQLYLAEARYELVANEIIADKQRITENSSKLTKSAIRDREWHKKTLHQRLLAWESCVITLLSMCKTRSLSVTELELRHTWVRLALSQCDEAEISRMRQNYEEFQVQLQEEAPELMVRFVNFPHIQTLSLDSVNGQISKLKVASTFSKIFSPDADEDISTRIAMLESILKGSNDASGDKEALSAREFLQHASIDFKHKLWYLLLDAYNESGEKRISVDGYIEMLTSLSYELETAGYRNMNPNQRYTILLRTLSTMNDTVGNLAKICRDTPALLETVSREKIHELAQLCLSFLRLLQVFNQFYDRRNPEEPTPFLWDKASEKFQTMMVKLWAFFYLLFRQLMNGLDEELPQTTISTLNDILSIVHEDLGHRKCCSFANGLFVDLTLDEIVRMKWNESEADLLQNIRCRFGIQLANEHYHPTDHGATPRALKRSDGLAFQDFIMNMVYRKPSSVHNIRADLRAVMDQLYEAIGDPDKNVASTSHNMAVLGRFTVAPVTWNYIENSLRGESFLPFMTSTDPVLSASTGGFYCVQGMLALAKFRQGKKAAAPGRTEDLQAAVKFFTNDILCCPTRYESWFGLANAFEMLTEDDLMWSAEKLDVPNSIVNINQRKALLCGLNSVNLMLQQRDEKPANPQLRTFFNAVMKESQWLFLSKLFYSATANPLHGASFRQADNKIFCGMKGLYMRQNLSLPRRKQCYQVVRTCLTISINSKDQPADWYSYYLRSKVYSKLKKTTQAVLADIQKSIEVAPDKINGDILLEPHYKLVAYLYKAVRRGKLTAEEAYKELKKTPHFVEYMGDDADIESGEESDAESGSDAESETEPTKDDTSGPPSEPAPTAPTALTVTPSDSASGTTVSVEDVTPAPGTVSAVATIPSADVPVKEEVKKKPPTRMEVKFYKSCVETLRRMKMLDKRKWHHRPPFLIARIHKEVFEDYRSAKEEMVPFFNLKNQSKAPVHIWKPDFERAGKHFQYVFDYLMFFVVLLDKTDDTDAITTIGKKLRRFNNGMVNHFEAWEFTCLTSNALMKRVTKIPEKLPDAIIPSLQFDNFDRIAQGLQDKITKNKEPASYLLSLLYYASEFRRLNNGFGSTGVVDDTVVCLYLKMLIEYAGTSLLADNKSRSSTPVVLDGAKFEFQPGSAQPPAPAAPAPATTTTAKKEDGKKEKTRVTRKDILLRATNLIKACSNKVGENIKLVTTKGPPAVASSNGSSTNGSASNNGTRSNSEDKEKQPTEEPEKSAADSDVEMLDASQCNTETTAEPEGEAEAEADKSQEEETSEKEEEEEKPEPAEPVEPAAPASKKKASKSKSKASDDVITIDDD
ncbi:Histone transcription regulator 3-like protein [Yarrowia sp. C11]|nr:Histone transcription regulator 3-like protein [Yarrowia sp. C11]